MAFSDNYTFQGEFSLPPKNYNPYTILSHPPDHPWAEQYRPGFDMIKKYEDIIKKRLLKKPSMKAFNIGETFKKCKELVQTANEIRNEVCYLENNVNNMSSEQWTEHMSLLAEKKKYVEESLLALDDDTIQAVRNQLAKRSSKRLRQKRIRIERKIEKTRLIQEWNEKSRIIDENLQKVKDEVAKTKEEEEMKVKTDSMLREVRRKKHDANKYISKLDALTKLRVARQNTAKGRGDQLSESDAKTFNETIGKLKAIWQHKLATYESEEAVIKEKLKNDALNEKNQDDSEKRILKNIGRWKNILFGNKNAMPQRDFNGDMNSFVCVRSQWDKFLDSSGSSLPVGWVIPNENNFVTL